MEGQYTEFILGEVKTLDLDVEPYCLRIIVATFDKKTSPRKYLRKSLVIFIFLVGSAQLEE